MRVDQRTSAEPASGLDPVQRRADLFWGGPQGLFDIPVIPGAIEGTIWFIAKTLVFLYIYVWFRATLPRFRYDQLMDLGWKILIPGALGWFLLMAALRLGRDQGWNAVVVAVVSAVVLVICAGLMSMAMRVSRANREREGAMFLWDTSEGFPFRPARSVVLTR